MTGAPTRCLVSHHLRLVSHHLLRRAVCEPLAQGFPESRLRSPTAKDLALAGVFLTCQPTCGTWQRKGQIQKIKIFGTLMAGNR